MNDFKRKYKILLVDDNVFFRKALKMKINELVSEQVELIDEAHNGSEAIEKVKSKYYNLVLMDIDMPKMNGIEATQYINRYYPQIFIVALSMHNEFFYLDQMLTAGSRSYIAKDSLDDESLLKVFETIEKSIY